MFRIGICGHFGKVHTPADGQTVKTRAISQELITMLGEDRVVTVDTHAWRKRILLLFVECVRLINRCDKIIMMPAHNGVKIFPRLFLLFNCFFQQKLYYVVIGGWLPNLVQKHQSLLRRLARLNGIFVETHSMRRDLENLGLKNVHILSNFKRLRVRDEEELVVQVDEPLRFCTFSRVTKDKGIADAIDAVTAVNKILGRRACTLDIYGPVGKDFNAEFNVIVKDSSCVNYVGEADPKDAADIIENYFMLLFPTQRFHSEGIPGTIIDAYHAGVPVLAARWKSYADIMDEGITGVGFMLGDNEDFCKVLLQCMEDPRTVNAMKRNCLKKAEAFAPETVIGAFLQKL